MQSASELDGAELNLIWLLPFAGLLLSIALLPLAAPHVWERHFGKVAAFWAFAFLLPCAASFGLRTALIEALHALVLDYLPFILLLFALFIVAGGILIRSNLKGTPFNNTALLALGTLAASLVGTTGASMLLIRPVIAANHARARKVHIFVFFIFLIANIGGSLTPLGDPPLFLGFLKGVDFLWTAKAMLLPMLAASLPLLALFYAIDRHAFAREPADVRMQSRGRRQLRIEGLANLLYLACIVGAVLLSGLWHNDASIQLAPGVKLPLSGLVRDAALLGLSYLSWKTTRAAIRVENCFSWAPMQEVAMLFAGVFVTIIPALAILRAGREGALAPLLDLVSTPEGGPVNAAYFWLTGALTSFLDNAPTYLVFFNLAGGDAHIPTGAEQDTLLAISMGAVFMGANTYIGNAPNLMVRSICEEQGIKMPGFIGYMLWSGAILLPLFLLLTLIFF